MADKIKCSECEYCKFYHSRYGNRKSCFCEHPDQDYIMQYFNERDIWFHARFYWLYRAE